MTFINQINIFLPQSVYVYVPTNTTTSLRSEVAFIQGFLLSKNIEFHTYGDQEIFLSIALQSSTKTQIVIFSPENTTEGCSIYYGTGKGYINKFLPPQDVSKFIEGTFGFDIEKKIYSIFIEIPVKKLLKIKTNVQIQNFEKNNLETFQKIKLYYESLQRIKSSI